MASVRIDNDKLIAGVVILTVIYNFILSFLNAQVVTVPSIVVVAVDGMLVLTALYVYVKHMDRRTTYWFTVLMLSFMCYMLALLNAADLSMKVIRDILIFPVFIGLGTIYGGNIHRLVRSVVIVVLVVSFFEAFFLEIYSGLIDIKSYYINTRGYEESGFYVEDSDLFVSAYRPGDRFIPLGDLHRISSVFLEPVSMGNFVVFLAIYTLSFFKELSVKDIVFYGMATLLLVALSDSRFAFVSICLLALLNVLPSSFRRAIIYFIVPIVLVLAFGFTITTSYGVADNFPGRVAKTVYLITSNDLSSLLLGGPVHGPVWDSGYTYLLSIQGVAGLFLLAFLVMAAKKSTDDSVYYRYQIGLALYLSLGFLIGCSAYSIKTAGLMFTLYGYLWARERVYG